LTIFATTEVANIRVQSTFAPASPLPSRQSFPLLPTYDHVLKCSNLFNTLDARGAISVTERVGVIGRIRKLAVAVANAWVDQSQGGADFSLQGTSVPHSPEVQP
jgi:glycyl-tRNA synthetase alpha chain